jgi:Plasmid recombination enzyme
MNPATSNTDAPVGKPYAIMRIEKLKTLGALDRRYDHNMRIVVSENILPDHPPPVELLDGVTGTYSKLVTAKFVELGIDEKAQKGKIIAVEAIVTASRVWFDGADEVMRQQWIEANVEWARKKFGKGLISIKLHADEETPHLHIVAIPVVAKAKLTRGRPPKDPELAAQRIAEAAAAPAVWTLSFHDLLGGHRENLSLEQDNYHKFVKHLGLVRGEIKHVDGEIALGDGLTMDGTKYSAGVDKDGNAKPRRNIPPQEYRAEVKRLKAEAAAALAEATHERERAKALAIESENVRSEAIAMSDAVVSDRKKLNEVTIILEAAKAAFANDQRNLDRARIEAGEAAADAARAMVHARSLADQVEVDRTVADSDRTRLDRQKAELALLDRAADDSNGLQLRRSGETITMNPDRMTECEQTTYREKWTVVGLAIAVRIADMLHRARALLRSLTDREALLKAKEAEHAAKEAQAERIRAEVDAARRADDAAHRANVDRLDIQLRSLEQRESIVVADERKAAAAMADAQRKNAEADNTRQAAERGQQEQRDWAEIVSLIVKGELNANLRADGFVRMAQKVGGGRHPAPEQFEETLEKLPPEWVSGTLTQFNLSVTQKIEANQLKLAALELSDMLKDQVSALGAHLPEARKQDVGIALRKAERFLNNNDQSIY